MILLALMRLGENAYGVPISREIERQSRREIALSTVYAALEHLEESGLVSSELGESHQNAAAEPSGISISPGGGCARSAKLKGTDQFVARRERAGRRTGMRSSKPPVTATWLLEHLIPGGRTEELAGDLWSSSVKGARRLGIGVRH